MKVTGHVASDVPAPPLLPLSRQSDGTSTPGPSQGGGESPDDEMVLKKIASQIALLADLEKYGPLHAISTLLDGHVAWRGDVDWELLRKFGIEAMVKRKAREGAAR